MIEAPFGLTLSKPCIRYPATSSRACSLLHCGCLDHCAVAHCCRMQRYSANCERSPQICRGLVVAERAVVARRGAGLFTAGGVGGGGVAPGGSGGHAPGGGRGGGSGRTRRGPGPGGGGPGRGGGRGGP